MRRGWELEDLIACWALDEEEFALLANKSGATRLGFAVLLKYFEQEARFPRREDVTRAAVDFVAGGGVGRAPGGGGFRGGAGEGRSGAVRRLRLHLAAGGQPSGTGPGLPQVRQGDGAGRGRAGGVAVRRHVPGGDLAGPAAGRFGGQAGGAAAGGRGRRPGRRGFLQELKEDPGSFQLTRCWPRSPSWGG